MKKVLLLCGFMATTSAYAASETKEFTMTGMDSLEIQSTQGTVQIKGTASNKAVITAEKVNFSDKCELNMRQDGDDLKVDVKDKKMFGNSDCQVNFVIELPARVNIDIKQKSGNITIEGTEGEIEYKIGSGDVKIDAKVMELNAKSKSGTLEAKGVLGDVELDTDSAKHTLTYAAVPLDADLEVKTSSGSTEVFLPKETVLKLKTRASAEKLTNEFATDKNSKFEVSFKGGSGSLALKKIE